VRERERERERDSWCFQVIVLLEKRINGEETLDCSDGYEEEDERRLSVSFSFPHFKPIFTLLSSFSFFCYSLLHESQSSSCIFILFFPFMAGE
jgi:hypothetical protein